MPNLTVDDLMKIRARAYADQFRGDLFRNELYRAFSDKENPTITVDRLLSLDAARRHIEMLEHPEKIPPDLTIETVRGLVIAYIEVQAKNHYTASRGQLVNGSFLTAFAKGVRNDPNGLYSRITALVQRDATRPEPCADILSTMINGILDTSHTAVSAVGAEKEKEATRTSEEIRGALFQRTGFMFSDKCLTISELRKRQGATYIATPEALYYYNKYTNPVAVESIILDDTARSLLRSTFSSDEEVPVLSGEQLQLLAHLRTFQFCAILHVSKLPAPDELPSSPQYLRTHDGLYYSDSNTPPVRLSDDKLLIFDREFSSQEPITLPLLECSLLIDGCALRRYSPRHYPNSIKEFQRAADGQSVIALVARGRALQTAFFMMQVAKQCKL